MLILRANPKGGRPLKSNHFPLHEDEQGNFGYLIGYDRNGDKMLIPISLAEQIATQFGENTSAFKQMANKLKPKVPFRQWLFLKLFGRKVYNDLKEYYVDEVRD